MFILEAVYWALGFAAEVCVALGLGPDAVTWASLLLGIGSSVAAAAGHFGIASCIAAMAALGDALDGIVARATGAGSAAGEVFDAAVDRYTEFFFVAGICLALRTQPLAMVLAFGAQLASFMVSYSTAKAEAMGVEPPRGLMRRGERAAFLITGCALTPLSAYVFGPQRPLAELSPLLLSLSLIALLGNASAIHRLMALAKALRAREQSAHHPSRSIVATPSAPAGGQ